MAGHTKKEKKFDTIKNQFSINKPYISNSIQEIL